MYFNCHICTQKNDRYHTVWMPDRYTCSKKVYPICFDCCDSICHFIGRGVLKQLLRRNITGRVL